MKLKFNKFDEDDSSTFPKRSGDYIVLIKDITSNGSAYFERAFDSWDNREKCWNETAGIFIYAYAPLPALPSKQCELRSIYKSLF